jgi:hypothetical protein
MEQVLNGGESRCMVALSGSYGGAVIVAVVH